MIKKTRVSPGLWRLTERGKPTTYYVKFGVTDTQGKRRYPEGTFDSEELAMLFMAAEKAGAKNPTPVIKKVRTVEDACAFYIRMKEAGKASEQTVNSYRYELLPLRTEYPTLPLIELDVDRMLDLRDKLQHEGYMRSDGRQGHPRSATSCNYNMKIVGQMLRVEFKAGNVPNVVTDLLDALENDTAERATLSRKECKFLLAECEFDRHRVAWRLALYGLRRGEIAGLRWEDIDIPNRKINVVRTRVVKAKKTDGTRVSVKTTKTKKGTRGLPMSDAMAADLTDLKDLMETEKSLLGSHYQDNGWIIADESGVELSPEVIADRWVRMLKRLGLLERPGKPDLVLHDARHTCTTLFGLEKMPQNEIAAWLGHTSQTMTALYGHSQEEELTALGLSETANL